MVFTLRLFEKVQRIMTILGSPKLSTLSEKITDLHKGYRKKSGFSKSLAGDCILSNQIFLPKISKISLLKIHLTCH